MQKVITDDLDALINIFPPHIRQPLCQQENISELLEVVLDLGRPSEARFPQREVVISRKEVSEQDIDYVASRISSFGDENRAGIERTLHRISAIRNRKGRIVGLVAGHTYTAWRHPMYRELYWRGAHWAMKRDIPPFKE